MNASAAYQSLVALADYRVDDDIILLNGADVRPAKIRWLWNGWLARGKLHILAGAPGQGKTSIALALAAAITCGGAWPDGSHCRPANVLVWSGEDDVADTLLPRLLAMGADPMRITFIVGARANGEECPFDPARDLVRLSAVAEDIGNVALMIVDPVVSAVSGDGHKNTDVRKALQPLVNLASTLDAAVLGITHFSKGTAGREPTERVTGSVAFGAVARIVLVAAKVKQADGDGRIFARAKSNIGPDEGGFRYELTQEPVPGEEGLRVAAVRWGEALNGTARELLAEAENDPTDDGMATDADQFLRTLLANGPQPVKSIKADADGAGYSWDQIKRASLRVGTEKHKSGMAGGWVWSLRSTEGSTEGSEGSTQKRLLPSLPSLPSGGTRAAVASPIAPAATDCDDDDIPF